MSPILFIYIERGTEEAVDEIRGKDEGGVKIKTIIYAEDLGITEVNEMELQRMLAKIMEKGEEFGMRIQK